MPVRACAVRRARTSLLRNAFTRSRTVESGVLSLCAAIVISGNSGWGGPWHMRYGYKVSQVLAYPGNPVARATNIRAFRLRYSVATLRRRRAKADAGSTLQRKFPLS